MVLQVGHHRELGEFLRTRRERLTPAEVGLPQTRRRRTPGLRREEVALISGVSTTWYTYLEQGRDIRVSSQVLEALARVLHLDDTERAHLYLLAHGVQPVPTSPPCELVDPSVSDLLHALDPHPAYVTGRSWNLLDHNTAAAALFDGITDLPAERNNLIWWMFIHPGAQRTLADWNGEARRLLARFRGGAARYPVDPSFGSLRDALLAASPRFRDWWHDHDVLPRTDGIKLFCQPHGAATHALRHVVLASATTPDQKIVVYLPVHTANTPDT